MSDSTSRFPCAACRKSYRWKPELAGRKVKCTCGHVMVAPSQPPAPQELEDDLIPLADENHSTAARRPATASQPDAALVHTVMGHQILASTATGVPAITAQPATTAEPASRRPAPNPKPVAVHKATKPPAQRHQPAQRQRAADNSAQSPLAWFRWWHAVIAVAVVLAVAVYLILARD